MSQIDSMNLTPLWGTIGQMKGYLRSLGFRVQRGKLPVTSTDIESLYNMITKIDDTLAIIVFGKTLK
jgi:hypothetical protein